MSEIFKDVEGFIEKLPIGVVVLDSAFGVRNCNTLAFTLLNARIEDCLVGNFMDAIDNEKLKDSLRQVSEGISQQCHLVLESPESVVACTIKTIYGESGTELIIIAEDATQIRDLARIKLEFIGSLLHRIRNPLSTLKTSLAMVQNDQMGVLPPDINEILNMGYHEVNRLSVLLNDMRDLFLIETGLAKKDFVIETFTVAEVVARAVTGLDKMDPPFNTIRQRLKLCGTLDAKISADFEKTKGILRDVLKNAVQYSSQEDAGGIELFCKYTDGPIGSETSVTIQVRDGGDGIGQDKLPLLFTKYFREDTPNTRKYEGNGLGLFLARSFAELMNGSMYCESVKGKGSSFFVTLPCIQGQ